MDFLQEQICGMCKILRLGIPRIRSAGWHGLKTIAGHTHERSLWDGPPLSSDSVGWRWLLEGKDQPMKVAVLGIDLGKNSCSVVGLDHAGTVVKRRRMRPESIPAFTRTMPTCTVAMEACCGAH